MSSQETIYVSRMAVTPTSGKGTLGTWWFYFQRGVVGHRADRSRTHEMNLSCEQTIWRRGVCAPALEPRGEREGLRTRGQGFKPDLRNSAVRQRVQEKLVCSVGDRPTRVIVRSPVAWIAERREIEFLMPIDNAIVRMVSKSSGRNESERRCGLERPETQRKPSSLP